MIQSAMKEDFPTDNYTLYGIPKNERTYVTPGLDEYKQELGDYCDAFHGMITYKRGLRKERERFVTRMSNDLDVIQEEQSEAISNPETQAPPTKVISFNFDGERSILKSVHEPMIRNGTTPLIGQTQYSGISALQERRNTQLHTQKSNPFMMIYKGRCCIDITKTTQIKYDSSNSYSTATQHQLDPLVYDKSKTISYFYPQLQSSESSESTQHSGYTYSFDDDSSEVLNSELDKLAYSFDNSFHF